LKFSLSTHSFTFPVAQKKSNGFLKKKEKKELRAKSKFKVFLITKSSFVIVFEVNIFLVAYISTVSNSGVGPLFSLKHKTVGQNVMSF